MAVRSVPSRRLAAVQALAAVAVLVATAWVYGVQAPDVPIVALELAGSASAARALVGDGVSGYREAVGWDFVLIPGYVAALLLACGLRRVLTTGRARRRALVGAGAAAAAGLLDVAENVALLVGTRSAPQGWTDLPFQVAAACATAKFALLVAAVPVALVMLAVTTTRLLGLRQREPVLPGHVVAAPPCEGEGTPGSGSLPPDGRWRAGAVVPPGREPAAIGICASGGGVRSACVTLGALQVLRDQGVLGKADYLVSVSGGGYATGAFQLALRGPQGEPDAPVEDLFAAGSVEEDHLRRHGSYISDGAREWVAALNVVLRGVLINVALAVLVVTSLGVLLGRLYAGVDFLRPFDLLRLQGALASGLEQPPLPAVTPGAWLAIGGLLALAAGIYAVWVFLLGVGVSQRALLRAGEAVVAATALVALVAVGLPLLMAEAVRLVTRPTAERVLGGTLGPVLLTYVGTLASLLWRNRSSLRTRVRALRGGTPGVVSAVPTGLVQRLIVLAALVSIVASLALLLGLVAVAAPTWPWWQQGAPLVLLAAAYALLDQTWLSLHPFYRRRIASAFAVRRGRHRGLPVAVPYDFAERTRLSRYAAPTPGGGFPRVIFAAAANLSGQGRTPPGRKAVSFTFASDWVGGPDVGYVRTAVLQRAVSEQMRRDLTVQAAVAVSGAAFASAMGRQARAFETFLAMSNARLGTWLPNPASLLARSQAPDDWTLPGPPRLRRLGYLVREITGSFPDDDRLLLCTDGGHYENLGLVELLRQRAKLVYCIDASGDSPPFASTLADAITLAREELGIVITLSNPRDLVPGSGTPLDPSDPLADLNGRLSAGLVVTGTITYPHAVAFPDGLSEQGTIVIAKASLTADLPYPLLAYAATHPTFPRDTTSDQWFDHGQFDAYTALGREMGRAMAPNPVAAVPPVPAGPVEIDLRGPRVTPGTD